MELTTDDWDSLQSLLGDDLSIKTELSSPASLTSSVEFPDAEFTESDSVDLFPVVQQPTSSSVVDVPAALPFVSGNGDVSVVTGSGRNVVGVMLNSKVKIRPKPISILTTTSTSVAASQQGL